MRKQNVSRGQSFDDYVYPVLVQDNRWVADDYYREKLFTGCNKMLYASFNLRCTLWSVVKLFVRD